jgi:tripeptide aminopeptidase
VPTPNIFDGGFNYHSVLEWAALPAMARACRVVLNLVDLWAQGGGTAARTR